jgi:hypothetical protein
MSATRAGGSSANATGPGAEPIEDEIARSLTLPRALIEANLRAGAALLDFAGQCIHAETEFLERLSTCHGLQEASTLHTRFVADMIDESGRELTALLAVARENVAQIADAAQPPSAVRPL